MSFFYGLGCISALTTLAGLVTAGSPLRRAAGLALGVALLGLPFVFSRDLPVGQAVLALASTLGLMRVIDLARLHADMPAPHRVWHVLATFDTRQARRIPRSLPPHLTARLLGFVVAAAACLLVALWVADLAPGPLRWVLRWSFGVLGYVAAFEVMVLSFRLSYAPLGIAPPPLHDAPWRSRTVAELWGRRWNRVVGGWLRANCFMPLARRGWARAGVVAAFVVSAAIHWFQVFVPLGWGPGLMIAAFFLLQPVLLVLERRLRVSGWRPGLGRAWTLGTLALASPLLVEPFFQLLE